MAIFQTLPLAGIKHAVSVVFDHEEGFLYWADDQTKSINRAKLDGSQQHSVISKDLFMPDGLAIDSVSRNIYFVDVEAQRIQVANLSGKNRKTIISKGLGRPRSVAVDSYGGRLYWTDWGIGMVERSYLDGSRRETLITTDCQWPNGLTLDLENGKMYWGDARYHRVEEANLDGSMRRTLQKDVPHMFGLTMHDGYLYWSEWKQGALERFHIADRKRDVIVANTNDLMMLWAGGIRRKPSGSNGEIARIDPTEGNSCRGGGGCSHLCMNTPGGKVCACPDNMTPAGDGKNCVVDRPILLVATVDGRLVQATMLSNNSVRQESSDRISNGRLIRKLQTTRSLEGYGVLLRCFIVHVFF